MTILAVSIEEPGRVALIQRPRKELWPGAVRVRVQACGICTLEKRIYSGALNLGYPLVAGHEVGGVIEEVGPMVLGDFRPGQRVALDLLTRCGQCHWCRRGHTNRCENRFKGRNGMLGGLSQEVVVPAREVFVLPETVPPALATLAEPLADCLHCLARAGLNHQDPVAVVGLGVMGQLHMALLSHLGHVTAPQTQALDLGLGLLGKGGTLVTYSSYGPSERLSLDLNRLHYNEISLTGTEGRTELDFERAVGLLAAGTLDLRALVSRTYPAQEAALAFVAAQDPDLYRVVVTF
ncbi:MAG: alcohol dehydrogenase catalytic domain-containing protein [Desulfarculus sp.]|nr:alcohol dehydrogenase catalytic domain-containing protein [Desulfarculus sp.]